MNEGSTALATVFIVLAAIFCIVRIWVSLAFVTVEVGPLILLVLFLFYRRSVKGSESGET